MQRATKSSASATLLQISWIAKIASRQQLQLSLLVSHLPLFIFFPERLSPRTPSSLGSRVCWA